jgi:hypothetical protein
MDFALMAFAFCILNLLFLALEESDVILYCLCAIICYQLATD